MKTITIRKDTSACEGSDPVIMNFESAERANEVAKMFRDKFMKEHEKEISDKELRITCDNDDCFEVSGDENFITLFKVEVSDCNVYDKDENDNIFFLAASVLGYFSKGEYHI